MIYHYNDTAIFYDKQGQGPVWVLLHGFLESSKMWDLFIRDFSEDHTLITVDLPGHGNSGCVAEIHTMEIMAKVVNVVLDHLQITNATFIGHSMGGYVCLALAETHAEKINKLVLLNSSANEDNQERKESRNRVLRIIKTNREAFISMAITNLFAEESRAKHKETIATLKADALKFPSEGIVAAIKGMKTRKDRTAVLKGLENKAYFIYGAQDPIVPQSDIESITKNTNATLFKVDGGHMSWVENYDKINAILHLIDKT